jgi:hypothetical protein
LSKRIFNIKHRKYESTVVLHVYYEILEFLLATIGIHEISPKIGALVSWALGVETRRRVAACGPTQLITA